MNITLPNPIPYELAISMARHLRNITHQNGFLTNITAAAVYLDPKNIPNAGISPIKNVTVNVSYDLDDNQDQSPVMMPGVTNYHSTIFANFYFYCAGTDYSVAGNNPQWVRAAIQSDLHRYFFNFASQTDYGRYPGPENNSLPNQNGQPLCRNLFIRRLNFNMDFQKKPIFQLDVEFNVRWAAVESNLFITR